MNSPFTIRNATVDDAKQITDIYNEAILSTTATFDTEVKTEQQGREWLEAHDERHPVFVAELDGSITGWGALTEWSDRPAYYQTVESSFYVAEAYRGRGIGRALKQKIVDEARRLGFHTLIARMAEGSDASYYLNEDVGFELIGTMKQVGRKFGRRLDVHIMQLMLNNEPEPVRYLDSAELQGGVPYIRQAPNDKGLLSAIVFRPESNLRESVSMCRLSPQLGVHGDNWARGCWKSLPDGSPDPDVQIAITNTRAIALIAQAEEHWQLAGDNLYVDMNLSYENLPPGQRLAVGSAVIEITAVAHTGCKKFAERFGQAALSFVNSDVGKELNLRGTYAKVVQAGEIHVGDRVCKC